MLSMFDLWSIPHLLHGFQSWRYPRMPVYHHPCSSKHPHWCHSRLLCRKVLRCSSPASSHPGQRWKKKQRVPWCQLLTVRAIVICLMIWYDLNNGLNGCLLLQIHTLALFLLGGQDRKAMTCDMWQAPFISQSHLNPRSWIVAQIAGIFSWSFWESIHLQEHHLATFFCKVTTSRHAWQWSALVSSRRFRTSWASYVDRLESRSHRVSKKVSLETNLNGI